MLSGYHQVDMVGYQPGMGHATDPNLNGWGMTSLPDGSFCVSNTFTTGLATFYNKAGHVLPLQITVPASPSGSAFLGLPPVGHPTGVVYNSTSDFVISENGKSAPATLIFDSIDGTISGWNPAVDPTHAILMRDTFAAGTPAVYTGLEIGQDSNGNNVLYATDFLAPGVTDPTAPQGGEVQMIGKSGDNYFATLGTFTDSSIPSFSDGSYGAWSAQAVNGKLYVTFASLKDLGGGVVDVFDTDGNLLTPNHFAANVAGNGPGAGPLQNPWGITQAPAKFGAYSNDLLVGNVAGAGNINVFDPVTGAYLGMLRKPNGAPIAIKGLWDLEFGDGPPDSGRANVLFFDAGPNHPGDSTGGLFGAIRAGGDQGDDAVAVAVSNQTLGMSASLPSFSSQQSQWLDAHSPVSKALTIVAGANPQALEQPSDAFFSTLHALPASRESDPEMMDSQLSSFLARFHADLDTLETLG
ncbi:MAG TPA: TIGR03118 family protein [Gemmataceae bacterium]|nr:TIGR03118 family protein [Gemmataceae bacterium]